MTTTELKVEWAHQYLPESIGRATTIQNQHPGEKIARAITEVQERCVAAVVIADGSSIDATIKGNVLKLSGGGGLSNVEVVFDPSVNGIQAAIDEKDNSKLVITVGQYVPIGGVAGSLLVSGGPNAQPVWQNSVFTGIYWFRGTKYSLNGEQKEWWYHDVSASAGSWSDNSPGSTIDDEKYWRHTTSCGKYVFIEC